MFVLFVQLFSILSTFVSSTSFGDTEEASELSSASWSTIGDICHVAVLPGSFKLWSSTWLHRVVQFIPSLETWNSQFRSADLPYPLAWRNV